MRLFVITVTLMLLTGCVGALPDDDAAANGVVCFEGSVNAPWNANVRANGVRLDAEVDVTQISADEWISLYNAFCLGQTGSVQ